MSRKPSPRPFRLSDGIVLVAATAVGLALIKYLDEFNQGLFTDVKKSELFGGGWEDRLRSWQDLFIACSILVVLLVTPWSIALLALRLRQPRPRLRRIWRQPGAVACLMCVLPHVFWMLTLAGQAILGRWSGIPWKEIDFHAKIEAGSGMIILSLWIVLGLGRLARLERSWIDRAGRFIGVLMIVLFLTVAILFQWLNATIPRYTLPVFPPPPPVLSIPLPTDLLPPVFPEAPTPPEDPPGLIPLLPPADRAVPPMSPLEERPSLGPEKIERP